MDTKLKLYSFLLNETDINRLDLLNLNIENGESVNRSEFLHALIRFVLEDESLLHDVTTASRRRVRMSDRVSLVPRPPDFFYQDRRDGMFSYRVWLEAGEAILKISRFNGRRWILKRRVVLHRLDGGGKPDYRGFSGPWCYELSVGDENAILKVWAPDMTLRSVTTLLRRGS